MSKHNYKNPSKTIDTSNVESQKVTEEGQKKYYDDQGWEIRAPISDRECIYNVWIIAKILQVLIKNKY